MARARGRGGGVARWRWGGGVGGGAWAVPSNWCVPARGRSAPPLSALQAQRGAGPAAAGAVQQRLWCEARRPRLVSTLPADRDPRAPAPGDGAGSVGFTRRAGATRVTHASVSAMMKEFPSAIGDGQPRRVVRPAPPPPRECLRTPRGGASSCGVRGRGLGPQGDGVWAGQAYGLHSDCSRRSTHTRQPPPPFHTRPRLLTLPVQPSPPRLSSSPCWRRSACPSSRDRRCRSSRGPIWWR